MTVIYPELVPLIGERFFLTEGFKFFIGKMENLISERAGSGQVTCLSILFAPWLLLLCNLLWFLLLQKYDDFVEIATEAISQYTKESSGGTIPKWDKREVDEIVIAQVRN